MQKLVFISNAPLAAPDTNVYKGDIPINPSLGLNLLLYSIDTSGNTIYAIDVHSTFNHKTGENERQLILQEQGGVIIYRYLLNRFKDFQENLKVIFYSPISAELLAARKPENHILKLLPFVHCNYDGNFEAQLKTEAQKYSANSVPLFNNASENLLSGWALYKAELNKAKKQGKQIEETDFIETVYRQDGDVSKRKLVFIDDQIGEWKTTFKNILEQELKPSFLHYNKSGTTVKGFDTDKISNFEKDVKDADLVISDFYLEESHEPNTWMSKEQLEKISGFKLFEKIKGKQVEKGINKGAGYILHSSSNKIPYYRILDANGIDNWLVKDVRVNTSAQEKIENFRNLKNGIEEFTANDNNGLRKSLKNLWARIENFDGNKKWWQVNGDYNNDEIFHILKSSWFTLRGFANRQDLFMEKSGVVDINFTPASVIASLGKLNELFNIDGLQKQGNCFQKYLVQTRNAGSHYSDLDQIHLIDALAFFDSWLNALNSQSYDDSFKTNSTFGASPYMIQDTSGKDKITYKYRLLYLYMQFYNSPYSLIHSNPRKLIRKRVETLLGNAAKDVLLNEILNHSPKDKFNNPTSGPVLKKVIASAGIERATSGNSFFITENSDKIFITHK